MIYIKSYFKKELQNAYIQYHMSKRNRIFFALFLGLLSFAMHFVLQTLTDSVLSDAVPEIMQTSYFSTLYTYNSITFLVYVVYFVINYSNLSFAEIKKNRWYSLIKMGYKPIPMIFSKFIALILSVFFIYSIGFVFTILLTIFLKYNFILAYLPSLYFVGLFDLVAVTILFTSASLFIKNPANVKYFIFITTVLIVVAHMLLGYNDIVANRVLMQNFSILFDFGRSLYLPALATISLAGLVIAVFKAKNASQYYTIPYYNTYDYVLPENTLIVKYNPKAQKAVPINNEKRSVLRSKIFNTTVTIFLVIFICAALAFNVFIILISTSQPGKEVTISGKIPYIFKSDTMEPTIMENDLAYFDRVGNAADIELGDVVLFLYDNTVYIERVTSIDGNSLTVDIDAYPPLSQKGVMIKTIERNTVYGIFSYRNRWLGALILFANTILGRVIFLILPALLLFFNKPMKTVFENRTKKYAGE